MVDEDIRLAAEMEEMGLGYPMQKEKASQWEFFNKILKLDDSIKVANLATDELKAIRTLRSAALYADTMGLDIVAGFLIDEAEVILASSDSKDGFLIKMAVTQAKKIETKSRSGTLAEKGGAPWLKKKQAED